MLYQLKSFIIISELHSVSLAAKKIYLTQPALTQHIRFLENHFGCKLLSRSGNSMNLTPEGEKLYHYAKDLVNKLENLERVFSADKKEQRILKFATIDSVTLSILPSAIKKLLSMAPDAKLIPRVEASGIAIQDLLNRKIDLALCTLDHVPPSIGKEILFYEDMIFIGSKEYSSIKDPKHLKDIPFILFPKSSMTRGLIDNILKSTRIIPKVSLETIKVSAIVPFVEAGMGISIIPYYSVYKDIKSGRVFQIPVKTNAKRIVGIAYSKEKPLSDIALRFIKCLRDEGKHL